MRDKLEIAKRDRDKGEVFHARKQPVQRPGGPGVEPLTTERSPS